MGERTAIEWTDHTFNPWIGCTKVSAGCTNCYAENLMDNRWGKVRWGKGEARQRTSASNWHQPIKWNAKATKEGVRRRVFCASLADVFDREVSDVWRHDLFTLIRECPSLDWLILTKRPDFMAEWFEGGAPENVWACVSIEDQKTANERLPILRGIAAVVRGVSYEPALGDVDWNLIGIDWIIAGGESEQSIAARECKIEWLLHTVRQCRRGNVACFVKQLGSNCTDWPKTKDPKGKDPAEWPADLRVREFPSPASSKAEAR